MELFIAVSVLFAATAGEPSGVVATLAYAAAPVAAPVLISPAASQFHVQDVLGQYSYGYANAQSAKSEARSANGVTVGGYKYVDGEGKVQSVEYSSDVNGFRVAASNLPVAPAVPEVPAPVQPVPVEDTPEVVEARTRHLAIIEEVKARSTQVPIALPAVSIQTAGAPVAVVKTSSSATVEATSTSAPVVEAKSAPPAVAAAEANSTAAPAIELRTGVFPGAILAPTVALAPGLSVRALPAVGVGAPLAFGYSINTVQPAAITYSLPLGAHLLATPVSGKAAPAEAEAAAAKETKESSD